MNIITFDIEEWYLEKINYGARPERFVLYNQTLEYILKTLEENRQKATFFCVGQMARHFPEIIKLIVNSGHEIGCHSNVHTWLDKMTVEQCREDIYAAVNELEQLIGRKILSFRAPAFSITRNNTWAFEVLAENGITRDASIFPTSRDFGGFQGFSSDHPCTIAKNNILIKEFPICPTSFLGHPLAYSGGGYFRCLPEFFIQNRIHQADYVMMYFHINDLADAKTGFMTQAAYEAYYKEPGRFVKRCKRYFKDNFAWGNTLEKYTRVTKENEFSNLSQADLKINWSKAPIIAL